MNTPEVYIIDGISLFAVNLDGKPRQIPGDWGEVTAMAVKDSRLVVLYRGGLMEVDTTSGAHHTLNTGWHTDTHLMVGGENTILLGQGPNLYAVDLDGSYSLLSNNYKGLTGLASLGTRYFVMEDQRLQEFMPMTSEWRMLRESWQDPVSIAGMGGKVYVAQSDGDIYQVDPDSGDTEVISREWPMMHGILPVGEHLMVVDGTTLYEAKLDGSYEVICKGWRNLRLWAGVS